MPNPISPARRSWTATLFIALALVLAWALAAPGVSHAQLGANWASRSLPTTPVNLATKQWGAVAYGGGKFVAVSSSCAGGTYCVMTSPDGITWTGVNDADTNNANWNSVAYGGGRYVAVGECNGGGTPGGLNCAATSTDGSSWQPPASLNSSLNSKTWSSVTYDGANSQFVAVSKRIGGGSGSPGDRVMTSPDGSTWTQQGPTNGFASWTGVAYGGGRLVAVSSITGSGNYAFMTSTDGGVNWSAQEVNNTWPWSSVAWGGPTGQERFVTVTERIGLFSGAPPSRARTPASRTHSPSPTPGPRSPSAVTCS